MKKTLLTTILAAGIAFSAEAPKTTENFNELQNKQRIDKIPKAIQYKTSGENCSEYVRLTGKILYDKLYSYTDAWNRQYAENIKFKFEEGKEKKQLDSLRDYNIIKPGMILGAYNPNSHRNNSIRDWKNKKPKYTHVLLYAGRDSSRTHYFLHEWGINQEKITLEELKKLKLKPIEILDESKDVIAEIKNFQQKNKT